MQKAADILLQELAERRKRNPAYSLRAFARDLKVSPAALSQILNGRRSPSRKSLTAIAKKLEKSPLELGLKVRDTQARLRERDILKDDEFRLISDWSCFAIMNLAKLRHCSADPKWIAASLNLKATEVEQVVERLQRLGYVRVQNRRLVRTRKHVRTTYDISSEAIRQNHRQVLSNATRALETIALDKREFISVTSAINTARLPDAKVLIRKFIDEMSESLQGGPNDEVYTMAVQLFPLSQTERGKNS